MPVLVEDVLLGRLTRPGSIGSCHPMTVLQIHLSRRLGIAVLPIHGEQHVAVAIPADLAPDLIFEPAVGKFTPISYYQRSFRMPEGATGEGLDRLLPQVAAPIAAFDSADFLSALPASERLASLFPEDRGHLINHARACLNKGDLQQAINTYGQVLKMNPRDLEALLGVAGILYQVDRLEEASRYFTAALQIIEARNRLAEDLSDPLPRPANNVVETVYANAALFENRLRQVDPANELQHLVNARQFMLRAAEANPKATEPHHFIIDWTWELAVRLFAEGKAEDVVALYEEGLPVLFDNPGYAVDNVVAVAAAGNQARAKTLLDLAMMEPDFKTALQLRIADLKSRGLGELAGEIEGLLKGRVEKPT